MANLDLDIAVGQKVPLLVNQDGGTLNLFPGLSTGFGRAHVAIKKSAVSISSSAVANTFVDGFVVGGFKTLVNAVLTPLVHLNLAQDSMHGGKLDYSVQATNGVDFQIETGSVFFRSINKGGVYTHSLDNVTTGTLRTSGILPVLFTLTDGTNLNVLVTSSLIPSAGFPRIEFTVTNLSNLGITLI